MILFASFAFVSFFAQDWYHLSVFAVDWLNENL